MRRKEKAITDPAAIQAIVQAAKVCRLAMCGPEGPYVVPLCFGYRQGAFFFHCAAKGHKLDLLDADPRVCLELEGDVALQTAEKPCDWGMTFRSVIAFGSVRRLTDPDEKRAALDAIMDHYGTGPWTYTDKVLAATVVLRMDVDRLTAKRS